ncbi:MAG: squalene/phytoene synthase family protein [Sphingomonas sp.]
MGHLRDCSLMDEAQPSDLPERALALSYAVEGRDAAAAILALDDRLATIMRRTRDPLTGQMRLTWWHNALTALDPAAAPAEPVLQALATEALPRGVDGATLAAIVEGWEALLEEPLTAAAVAQHAGRGRALFAAIGGAIGAANDPLDDAGAGWALADLARHLSDPALAQRAGEEARRLLGAALGRRWSRRGRMLGALAHLARADLARPDVPPGAPRRVLRLLRHRLTGR